MAELRWLLLVVGLAVVAGIFLYTKFKPRLDRGLRVLAARREPTLGNAPEADFTPEPSPRPSPGKTDPMAESQELPPAEVPLSPDDVKIVAIRLLARDGKGFPGEQLILKMRELGLKHGEFGIFHRDADAVETGHDFSVASLVEPGSFDLTRLRTDAYPGVSIFMRLPGSRDGVEIFDDMLQTSRTLAQQLDGELLDEQGSTLSIQRERYLREEVIQFEHQGIS